MTTGNVTVRRLRADDAPAWRELWAGYLRFYRRSLPSDVTERSFERLCAGGDDMHGLVGVADDQHVAGFAHVVFHASTWTDGTYCYLEDLFVAGPWRGRGVARALIARVFDDADERGAARMYWHTQEYNAPARALYDEVARRTSFIRYDR